MLKKYKSQIDSEKNAKVNQMQEDDKAYETEN